MPKIQPTDEPRPGDPQPVPQPEATTDSTQVEPVIEVVEQEESTQTE